MHSKTVLPGKDLSCHCKYLHDINVQFESVQDYEDGALSRMSQKPYLMANVWLNPGDHPKLFVEDVSADLLMSNDVIN